MNAAVTPSVNALTNKRVEQFSAICRTQKLPLTPQKMEIFRYLAGTTAHPSAQEIFVAMQKRFPNISFATVYKNLNKFKELNLVREIPMKDNTTRFDANMENHHHIINLDSGDVIDVPFEEVGELRLPKMLEGYQLEKISVKYYVRTMPEKKE